MSHEELKSFYERGLTILRQHHDACMHSLAVQKEKVITKVENLLTIHVGFPWDFLTN